MPLLRKFLCWDLRTAVYTGYCISTVNTIASLLYRLLDLGAITTSFEISQGFQTPWRSHQWQAFLASDIILIILHIATIIFSVIMIFMVRNRHFVMYQEWMKIFFYYFCLYVFVEFCFSVFEFSFYGLNTFRLAFVVFLWLFWLWKTIVSILFGCILYSRIDEMADEMAMELRFSDKKYSHSYA